MACTSCASGGCSTPSGCQSNGGCQSGSCNKFNSFDWLSNMSLPGVDMFDVVEVRFKGGRKEFFRNNQRLFLTSGDAIVVEMANGHHIGYVALQGELVRLQMKKRKTPEDSELSTIYRKANAKDLERYEEVRKREMPTMFRTRQIVEELNLKMKLSDVEYQADNTKATFYYSADDRVDFRELIKSLAGEFKIRVEMRQISLRQEASRIGGIGSCGRELCCSTWLSDFKTVATSAARYQNLSLNPTKLSGQCGRLKCCLNYELETYQDALLDIPEVREVLVTEQGEAQLQKVDIFKKTLWFSLGDDNNWYPVEATRVRFILDANKKGLMPRKLMSAEMSSSKEFKSQVADSRRLPHPMSKNDVDPNELVPLGAPIVRQVRGRNKPDADLQELERLEALERREIAAVQQDADASRDVANRSKPQRPSERRGQDNPSARQSRNPENRRNEPRTPRQDSTRPTSEGSQSKPNSAESRPRNEQQNIPKNRPSSPKADQNAPRHEQRTHGRVNRENIVKRDEGAENPVKPPIPENKNTARPEIKHPEIKQEERREARNDRPQVPPQNPRPENKRQPRENLVEIKSNTPPPVSNAGSEEGQIPPTHKDANKGHTRHNNNNNNRHRNHRRGDKPNQKPPES